MEREGYTTLNLLIGKSILSKEFNFIVMAKPDTETHVPSITPSSLVTSKSPLWALAAQLHNSYLQV